MPDTNLGRRKDPTAVRCLLTNGDLQEDGRTMATSFYFLRQGSGR